MNTLITNARVVGDGQIRQADVRIVGDRIDRIDAHLTATAGETILDADGRLLLPGMIDDQVHFREPGLTSKGDIASESAAAAAGGITSYMEMPNTSPPTVTRARLAEKFAVAAGRSTTNYSFYLGATNDNLAEIRALQAHEACGVKVFMGASTGNMLVDNPDALAGIFEHAPGVVATHCEDTPTINEALEAAQARYGRAIPPRAHAAIRSREACLKSTRLAVGLAREFGTRLHVLHLTTADELVLFEPGPVESKQITVEACVHHLYFCDEDYAALGNLIKCNPSIKSAADRAALRQALAEGRIDIIATDHAPHLLTEKGEDYLTAAAGLPLAEFTLQTAWQLVADGVLDAPGLVEKVAHNPARRFNVVGRGFIREGYYADLVLLDPDTPTVINEQRLLSKCGWTPFQGRTLPASVIATWVNGELVWAEQRRTGAIPGSALQFG